jgi:predicted  nucleic acid-binding Zn-ribbon protein
MATAVSYVTCTLNTDHLDETLGNHSSALGSHTSQIQDLQDQINALVKSQSMQTGLHDRLLDLEKAVEELRKHVGTVQETIQKVEDGVQNDRKALAEHIEEFNAFKVS